MSKKDNVQSNVQVIGWGNAYVAHENTPRRLEGRILTLLETLGLSERQEEAAKGFARQIVWDEFSDAVYITGERHTEIRLAYNKEKSRAGIIGQPMQAI